MVLRSKLINMVLIILIVGATLALYLHGAALLSCVSYPFIYLHARVSEPICRWASQKKTIQQLKKKVAQLEKKNEALLATAIRKHAQLSYLETTKELRSFSKRYKSHFLLSQVLVRSFGDQEHYFYIEGGAMAGVEKDMIVTYKNQLVGKVDTVYPWYSKVCLITDPKCKIAAYCPASKAHGIHEGIYQQEATRLSYVSHLHTVKQGDWVLSSGEGIIFPKGFALGRVHEAQKDDLYQLVGVKPACDLNAIEYCMIHRPVDQG